MLVVGECSTTAEIVRLEDEWRELESSTIGYIFQSYDWIAAAVDHLCGDGDVLRVLTARLDGRLVGIAPLCEAGRLRPRIQFIGTGVADYGDFLSAEGLEDQCAEAFCDRLLRGRRVLGSAFLRDVRAGSSLERQLNRTHLRTRSDPGPVCPYLQLPGSWEEFLEGLGRNARSNLPRYSRKLEREFELGIDLVRPRDVEESMEALFELHARKWNASGRKGSFHSPVVRSFHLDVATRFATRGSLRLYSLTLDGVSRAVLYCFTDGSIAYFYQSGVDQDLGKYRLGHVLIGHAIRVAIEEGCSEFDLLRGDEEYKINFWRAATDRMNVTLHASRGLDSHLPAAALARNKRQLPARKRPISAL